MGTALLAQSNPDVIEAAFVLGGVEKTFTQSQDLDANLLSAFHRIDPLCGALCIAPLAAAND